MKKAALIIALVAALAGFSCKKSGEAKPSEPARNREAAPGCGESAENYGGVESVPAPLGETPQAGDMIIRHMPAEPGTLNPLTATDLYEQWVNYYVLETLLDMDLATGELKPALAESWDVSEDNLTFTFHLRKDATFHDGHPVTAHDFTFSIDRIMDPKVDAAVLRSFFMGMQSYRAVDDYTLEVVWKEPYFKALDTVAGTPVLPRHLFADGADFNQHPFGRHPVGSGPYKFVNWETGRKIELARHEGYWGKKPYLDRVQFKIITDDEVALRVLKKGEIDFMERLRPTQWVRQTNSPDFLAAFHKLEYDYPTFSYAGWNLRNPLFADRRVRQALTMLMNREAIRREVFHCLATVSTGPFYARGPWADPAVKAFPYDPERAKKLLAEVGWKDTDGDGVLDKDGKPFRFEMSFTAGVQEWEQVALIFREDLKKAGIDMKIRKLEWAVFLQNVQEWKFDVCCMSWALVPNPDPYQIWHSSQAEIKGSSNHVGYVNPKVDELIEKNRREFDREKRIQYCHEMHRLIHEDQPYTFIMVRKNLSAADKRFHNVIPYPIRPIFYYNEWYVPEALQKYKSSPAP